MRNGLLTLLLSVAVGTINSPKSIVAIANQSKYFENTEQEKKDQYVDHGPFSEFTVVLTLLVEQFTPLFASREVEGIAIGLKHAAAEVVVFTSSAAVTGVTGPLHDVTIQFEISFS